MYSFFRISSFNMDNAFFVSEAICDGSVGKDQSCFGKKIKQKLLVSMICKCRRILCLFFFSFRFSYSFFSPFFSIYLQNQKKIDKKI